MFANLVKYFQKNNPKNICNSHFKANRLTIMSNGHNFLTFKHYI